MVTQTGNQRAAFGAPQTVLGVAILLILVVVIRFSRLSQSADLQSFVLVFSSIAIEALPFVLMGSVASALIEVYTPESFFVRVARLPLSFQLPAAALGGIALPVCECGSVPVARRLVARGLHPAAALALMFSAPIVNPLVMWSTFVAYRSRGIGLQMMGARAAAGLVVAVVAGWALGSEGRQVLRKQLPGDEHGHQHVRRRGLSSLPDVAGHVIADFSFMARFVVIGGALAAMLQTLVPQDAIAGVARDPVLGSLALMALAYLLSLCSEADAFVAVSLTSFTLTAQLAFLAFGPVLDGKLTFMYGASFRDRFLLRLALVAVPVVLATSLWLGRFL